MFSPGVFSVKRVLKEPTATMADYPPPLHPLTPPLPPPKWRSMTCCLQRPSWKQALTDSLGPRKEDVRLRATVSLFIPQGAARSHPRGRYYGWIPLFAKDRMQKKKINLEEVAAVVKAWRSAASHQVEKTDCRIETRLLQWYFMVFFFLLTSDCSSKLWSLAPRCCITCSWLGRNILIRQ